MIISLLSCTTNVRPSFNGGKSSEPVYVVIDGRNVELVADEDGNQYLKYVPNGAVMYIPFPYNTSENKDSITYYQVKNGRHNNLQRARLSQ